MTGLVLSTVTLTLALATWPAKAGLAAQAPTVYRGPYNGDRLSVDHISPRAVVPELDNVIANLELMPLKVNEGKNAKVGARQLGLARKLEKAGLLSADGLRKVESAGK